MSPFCFFMFKSSHIRPIFGSGVTKKFWCMGLDQKLENRSSPYLDFDEYLSTESYNKLNILIAKNSYNKPNLGKQLKRLQH